MPFFSVILIFLGYWDLHFYFMYFDIPIYDFVSTGEIILSFLPKATYIFLYTIIVVLSLIISRSSGLTTEPYLRNSYDILFKSGKDRHAGVSVTKKIFSAFDLFVKVLSVIMILYFTIYAITEWSRSGDSVFTYRVPYVVLITIWSFLLMQFIDYVIEKKYPVKDELNIHNILLVIMLLITYLAFITFSDFSRAVQTLKGFPVYNIEFTYRDKQITSGKDTVFIGQTNNYFFLRDNLQGINLIYRKSELNEIKLRENKYDFIEK